MASTSDFKNGLCIEFNNGLYQIVEFQHVKPGKGPAFVRTKLKGLTNGKVIENTFTAGVKVTTARVERRPFQYLYTDDTGFVFMNMESFDQINLQEDLVPAHMFLKEGQDIEIVFHAETETPLFTELPAFIELAVTYTEPGVKGDTATNTLKPATLETGAEIQVPLFVDIDDCIKIDTRSNSYSERVKK
ncbi:MAG: elongation factor P [Bacteroidetes bacterium]|jgi:elongation factor P|nr:elongation factor P [Bacteroidota bacterium]MBT3421923.1 elongation factor P [Bacteroidota bacterium]MBT3799979.1 elongation factor P [Bacteroidota bacterium]MBT3933494.1 elongation factor P [Bacteroidota bacterium]MBT4339202.1 elongation factor P [Bacteroidota bacterium]